MEENQNPQPPLTDQDIIPTTPPKKSKLPFILIAFGILEITLAFSFSPQLITMTKDVTGKVPLLPFIGLGIIFLFTTIQIILGVIEIIKGRIFSAEINKISVTILIVGPILSMALMLFIVISTVTSTYKELGKEPGNTPTITPTPSEIPRSTRYQTDNWSSINYYNLEFKIPPGWQFWKTGRDSGPYVLILSRDGKQIEYVVELLETKLLNPMADETILKNDQGQEYFSRTVISTPQQGGSYKAYYIKFGDSIYNFQTSRGTLTNEQLENLDKIFSTFKFANVSDSNIKEYKNSNYSLSYPKEWFLVERSEKPNCVEVANVENLRSSALPEINGLYICIESGKRPTTLTHPYSLDGKTGTRGTVTSSYGDYEAIYVDLSATQYISFELYGSKTILDQILSTFKFTN